MYYFDDQIILVILSQQVAIPKLLG